MHRGRGLYLVMVLAGLILCTPMVLVAVSGFGTVPLPAGWEGFTLRGAADMFTGDDGASLFHAVCNSLIIAPVAAAIASGVATLAALANRRREHTAQRGVPVGLLFLPLAVPQLVAAVAALAFFTSIGLQEGPGSVLLAHAAFCTPFAHAPIAARLQLVDPAWEMAAQDLHATPTRAFRRILLPLLVPGIVSGFLLALAISLGDGLLAGLVGGEGVTLPVVIYDAARQSVTPNTAALATVLLAVSAGIVALAWRVGRKPLDR